MKNKLKYFYFKHLSVLVYKINKSDFETLPDLTYEIKKTKLSSTKIKYELYDGKTLVHESTLHKKLFFLKIVDKIGPSIGDCFTNQLYRGHSIYPKMLNYITKELFFEQNIDEVFMIVEKNNFNSIRGIEKAGFTYFASIDTHRIFFLYFKIKVIFDEN